MRAYFAVVKDSFREALASRVLWILLILTTIFLLAVAPFSIKEYRPTRLGTNSVFDWPSLIRRLQEYAVAADETPGKRIVGFLSDEMQRKLELLRGPGADEANQPSAELIGQFVSQFNALLGERGLYDAATWRDIELGKEADELLGRGVGRLSQEELARFNRLLLETSFPDEIARSTSNEIYVAYLGWKLGKPLAIAQNQVDR